MLFSRYRKNFRNKCLGSTVQRLFTKAKHILKKLSLIFQCVL